MDFLQFDHNLWVVRVHRTERGSAARDCPRPRRPGGRLSEDLNFQNNCGTSKDEGDEDVDVMWRPWTDFHRMLNFEIWRLSTSIVFSRNRSSFQVRIIIAHFVHDQIPHMSHRAFITKLWKFINYQHFMSFSKSRFYIFSTLKMSHKLAFRSSR